jgi:hypothetical protein
MSHAVTCSVCGIAIPDSVKLIAEHKYNGKICYGSYTPINQVNPFKNLIPEKPNFGYIGNIPVLNTGILDDVWDLGSDDGQ